LVTELELSFLCACGEAVKRQQELVPLLADHLGVLPTEVLYHAVIPPGCEQLGFIAQTEWKYFFHGLECDLKNSQDGRFLRLDFGPNGRFDTFSGWGILQFIMTTKAPWRTFPSLQCFLAEKVPPYNEFSGSHEKMIQITKRLEELNCFEVADPKLCLVVEQSRILQPDGRELLSLPPELKNNPRCLPDALVCGRWILSDYGKQLIAGDRYRVSF